MFDLLWRGVDAIGQMLAFGMAIYVAFYWLWVCVSIASGKFQNSSAPIREKDMT